MAEKIWDRYAIKRDADGMPSADLLMTAGGLLTALAMVVLLARATPWLFCTVINGLWNVSAWWWVGTLVLGYALHYGARFVLVPWWRERWKLRFAAEYAGYDADGHETISAIADAEWRQYKPGISPEAAAYARYQRFKAQPSGCAGSRGQRGQDLA